MILKRIQELCQEQGISIKQLESNLRFGSGTIYKWKMSEPSVVKLQKVANFFNKSIDYFIK